MLRLLTITATGIAAVLMLTSCSPGTQTGADEGQSVETCRDFQALPVDEQALQVEVAFPGSGVSAHEVARACDGSPEKDLATAVDEALQAEDVSEPSAAPSTSPAAPVQSTSQELVSSDGKSQTVTFEIGPVISGSDIELIMAEWGLRGGRPSDVACLDREVSALDGGFAVGVMTVRNNTPNFGAADQRFQFIGNPQMYIGFGFGNGSTCAKGDGKYILSPSWNAPQWGPIPFVVAIEGYRTPNSPDGDLEALKTPGNLAVQAVDGIAVKAIDYDTNNLQFVQIGIPLVPYSGAAQ